MSHLILDIMLCSLFLVLGYGIKAYFQDRQIEKSYFDGVNAGWSGWAKKHRKLADQAEDVWAWKLRVKATEEVCAEIISKTIKDKDKTTFELGSGVRSEIAKRVKEKKIEYNKTRRNQ